MLEKTSHRSGADGLRVVTIGGGNGLSALLSGLKHFADPNGADRPFISDLSAIVAVSDDGGSSGRLRDELQILPPGDVRNCMVALSEDSLLLSRLFRHRFAGNGELGGHNFGNIFLAALTDMTGDFAEAVRLSSEILASKGHIYPATTADVRLAAELNDGSMVRGETNISKVGTRIKRLFLEPETCHPMPAAIEAVAAADVITLGPGSLFTSILPPLLVHGVSKAVAEADAVRVFISNLMTQPGETEGMNLRQHLEVIREYNPGLRFDHILINDHPISQPQERKYALEGAQQIGIKGSIDAAEIEGARLFYANLLDDGEKVRHDPDRLAKAVLGCADSR